MKLFNFTTSALLLLNIALSYAKLVMIIRHGEKLNDDTTDLSPRGKARAYCLVNVFGNNGTYAVPQKIFAQSPSEKKQSTRPKDTVIPLAQILGLNVDLSYTSGKIKKLTNSILSSNDEVTLVSWSNDNIPEIAEKIGINNPPDWNSNVFDEIWMIYDSATTSYYRNSASVSKRETYTGGDYTMEIVKQNITECITDNVKYFVSNTGSSTSDSWHITSNLLYVIISIIAYLFI
ncbi:hypothetical protein H8356DRAFT_1617522 [Neocallimastix lanati (nom. inval.)]|nr:hypothetical protein H8356DRAFT_1617522 [Neocallimastix sp. JGI-2020a]